MRWGRRRATLQHQDGFLTGLQGVEISGDAFWVGTGAGPDTRIRRDGGPFGVRSSRMARAAPPDTIDDSYTPAFGPEVIGTRRCGRAKSSSVPITNRLSAVNSAWWALPSG